MVNIYPAVINLMSKDGDTVGTIFTVYTSCDGITETLGVFDSVSDVLEVVQTTESVINFLHEYDSCLLEPAKKQGLQVVDEVIGVNL
jgi:hypothetical protein